MAELSAYRDQHFRVGIHSRVFFSHHDSDVTLSNKLKFLLCLVVVIGHSRRAGKSARNQFDIVCRESVFLHYGRTDLWVIRSRRRLKKDYNGIGQSEKDPLRILLHRVSFYINKALNDNLFFHALENVIAKCGCKLIYH